MVDFPLFYSSVTPLNRERHRDMKLVRPEQPYGFAANTHVIPALTDEFGPAARHLPIVFLPGTSQTTPVFLVGLRPGKNRFVTDDGQWSGGYIPAFLRRYPFIVGEISGASPVICIDEQSPLLSREDGESLFNEDGTETALLNARARLSSDYMAVAQHTDALAKRLRDLDLLQPINIESRAPENAAALHGLFAVDENKLGQLDDEAFLQLRKDRFLGPIYAHLISLGSVDKLAPATT